MSGQNYCLAKRDNVEKNNIIMAKWSNFLAYYCVKRIDSAKVAVTCFELTQQYDATFTFITFAQESFDAFVEDDEERGVIPHVFAFDKDGILRSGENYLLVLYDNTTGAAAEYAPNLSIDTLLEPCACSLCGRDNATARLTGPLCAVGEFEQIWIHAFCYFHSARRPDESAKSLTERARNQKCRLCQHKGATVGCYNLRCGQNYHFACAIIANAEYVEEDNQNYCSNHLADKEKKRRETVGVPNNFVYIYKNDWSLFSAQFRNNLLQLCRLEAYRPLWLQRKFNVPIRIKQISANHWAWCDQMESQNRPQYDVVASEVLKAGQIIGEYVGQVLFERQDHVSDYAAALEIHNPTVAPFIVDSQTMGNEFRFVNSVNSATKKRFPHIHANATMQPFWCIDGPRIMVVLSADVAEDQSIVFDYGAKYWEAKNTDN